MNLNKLGIQFLKSIKNNLNSLHEIVEYCREKRKENDIQIKIIASYFLSILFDISDHLDAIKLYLHNQISIDEMWSSISYEIITKCIDNILNSESPKSESILIALIDRWDAYDKDDGRELFDKFMKGEL